MNPVINSCTCGNTEFQKYALIGLLLVFLILMVYIFYRATVNNRSKFDFFDSFLDINGKTSFFAIAQGVALMVTSLGFIYLIIVDKMTEWYFLDFVGAWVVNSVGGKFADKIKQQDTVATKIKQEDTATATN